MEDKRFAILIDTDNISSKYISAIMDEMTKHGIVTYRRAYGDWTSTQAKGWKTKLVENSITPMQQFSNTVGKNATDSTLIIDAMDILYTGNVDGFCIVSSDGDFTRLAIRLRESGMMVVGMGEEKTPRSFRTACSQFTVLENLIDEDEEDLQEEDTQDSAKSAAAKASGASSGKGAKNKKASVKSGTNDKESTSISKEVIESAIINIITENENKDKETGLGEIGSRLLNKYPDFDVRNYGYSLLSRFLEEIPSLKLVKNNTRINVELIANRETEEEVVGYIKATVKEKGKKGIRVNELSNNVHQKYTRFKPKNYGYSQFTKFLQAIPELELYGDINARKVRFAEDK
ncbi:MAG: NYN domain-containing protein [Lachnospiraceae bacterium]|nr:NYN domain-containing protein [Lachnospiraceae bacterium]